MKALAYTRTSAVPIVHSGDRHYTLTIHDLPNEEKPRERLIAEGPQHLTTAELLAVVLVTGTTKEDVLTMARRVVDEYGAKGLTHHREVSVLMEHGIPEGKAAQIVACAELGRRFFEKNEHAAPTIRTARDVFEHTSDMRALPKEHLRALYLNSRYSLIRDETISIGTVDANIIHPREVFKPGLECAAAAVVLVHNHPSGTAEPSSADIAVTEQLIQAGKLIGIEVVDHVIVTKSGYHSIPASYAHL